MNAKYNAEIYPKKTQNDVSDLIQMKSDLIIVKFYKVAKVSLKTQVLNVSARQLHSGCMESNVSYELQVLGFWKVCVRVFLL